VNELLAEVSFGPVWDQRRHLLGGIGLMIQVAVVSMLFAVAGGLLLARLRRSPVVWVRTLAFVLIQVLRGIALYVLVLWLFNGLAIATGITLTAVQTGVIALSLLNSAYLAEVFRAGYDAIPAGQGEAAQAIGLSSIQAQRFVLVPQMVRISFPAMGNVFVDIVKDTAILSVIGVSELMRETQRWAQYYFLSFEFYTAAGLVYLAIVLAVSAIWRAVERRLRVHLVTDTTIARRRRWRSWLTLPAGRSGAPA
jgi:His/Glu/Gln/Arg/opine family amino acid ABC transporter permease subunit